MPAANDEDVIGGDGHGGKIVDGRRSTVDGRRSTVDGRRSTVDGRRMKMVRRAEIR
jgi:hypothetical protein